jgi:predicted signal transduction protein with EAL and GGDEF domain
MKRKIFAILSNVPFASFELALIAIAVVMFLSLRSYGSLTHPEYVSNAVTGCATMTGVLSAFTGFWLTHIYTNTNAKTKEWLTKRIAIIVVMIGFSLLVILGSLNELVYGNTEIAMQRAIFGTSLILLVDLEVVFMALYKALWKKELGT